jgi:hypothetical protein
MKRDRVVTAAAAADLESKLHSPNGRSEIGQTMLEPFKEGRDYVSIGRRVLAVHHLEPGAPAWYELDPQFSAYTIGSLGSAPRVLDGADYDRVEVVHYPIVVLVRIGVEQPAIRRYDVLDREQVRAQAEMAEIEDTEIFRAIRTAGNGTGSGVSNGITPPAALSSTFALDNLSIAYSRIEDNDTNVENLLTRATEYRRFRSLDSSGGIFDPVTRRELIKTGYFGDLWNAQVRVSKKLNTGEMLLVAPPEFVGVYSVRIDLAQMDSPMSENLQYGWVLYQFSSPAILTNVGCLTWTITG